MLAILVARSLQSIAAKGRLQRSICGPFPQPLQNGKTRIAMRPRVNTGRGYQDTQPDSLFLQLSPAKTKTSSQYLKLSFQFSPSQPIE
jgi:hypothetical protein